MGTGEIMNDCDRSDDDDYFWVELLDGEREENRELRLLLAEARKVIDDEGINLDWLPGGEVCDKIDKVLKDV